MKLYFFGTPDFACPSLKELFNNKDFEIQKVVTMTSKPGDRGSLAVPPIKTLADELKLETIQIEKINAKLIEEIIKDKPDMIVVVAFGGLIPKELLNLPKYGCINVHPSLLPKYRGASPIQETLLNGDEETGISIMELDEGLDHGRLYLVRRVPIDEKDSFITLSVKLSILASKLLPLVLKGISQGILTPIKQDDSKATFCRKISKEDGEIDLHTSAKEILNQIRALNPWPSTYLNLKGKRIKILEAKIQKTDDKTNSKNPQGKAVIPDKNSFGFQTSDGFLIPTKLQIEGKSPVTAKDFLNGYKFLLE